MTVSKSFFAVVGNCSVSCSGLIPVHQFETIFLLQSRFSLRVSEVLRLSLSSLHEDFNICVKLSKCKEYIFIRDEECYIRLLSIFEKSENQTFTILYLDYYRYLKKYHPEIILKTKGKNFKVSHSFRYRNLKKAKEFIKDKQALKAKLHHQSVKSQEYYVTK